MIFRHGAILGLAEVAAVAGREGLGTFSDEIRQIPVSYINTYMPALWPFLLCLGSFYFYFLTMSIPSFPLHWMQSL